MIATPEAAAPGRRPLLTTSARIGLLVALVGAAAAGLFLFVVRELPRLEGAVELPWPLWVLAFAAGELLVVHIQLRKDSHSFSLTDLVLVAGLYLMQPAALVAAQLTGAALALVLHRDRK